MRLIFLVILISLYCGLFSQSIPIVYQKCSNCDAINQGDTAIIFNYGASEEFETIDLVSDFGPRNYTGYDWHGGIDFSPEIENNDLGDALIALKGGTLKVLSQGIYKYLVIDGDDTLSNGVPYDFGYGHIFSSSMGNQKSGNFYWQRMVGPEDNYAIITKDGDALYTMAGEKVVHPRTGDTLVTTNVVTQNMAIAPLGNSGTQEAHLHLYLFENNNFSTSDIHTKNPLTVCQHDKPDLEVKLYETKEQGDDFAPTHERFSFQYPGTGDSECLLRAKMIGAEDGNKYDTAVMNLEKVELVHKSVYSADTLLYQGPYYYSYFNFDGNLDTSDLRYPIDFRYRGQGSQGRTGMQPWAYSDTRRRPWDYFNFADIVSRIHKEDSINDQTKEIADVPQHARYRDDIYELFGRVVNTVSDTFVGPRNSQNELVPLMDTLDNFYPHITEVNTEVSGVFIASQSVSAHDPNRTVADDGYIYEGDKNSLPIELPMIPPLGPDLKIEVHTSEPMDTLSVSFPDLYPPPSTTNPIGMVALDSTRSLWSVEINGLIGGTGIQLEQDSCYQMVFSGQDLSGNPILNIGKYKNEVSPDMKVPTRQDTMGTFSDWNNLDTAYTGSETLFSFCIKSCEAPESGESPKMAGTADCDFEVSHTREHSFGWGDEGSITVTSSSSYDYIEFFDENENIIQSGLDSILDSLSAGIYCYTVWKDCCAKGGCAVVDDCSTFSLPSVVLAEGYNTCLNDTVSYTLFFEGQDEPINTNDYLVWWESIVDDTSGSGNPWHTFVRQDTVEVLIGDLTVGCLALVDTFIIEAEGYKYDLRAHSPEIGHTYQCSNQWGYILLENRMSTHDSILWLDNQSTTYNRYGLNSGEYCVQVYTGACDTVICMTVDSVFLDSCDFSVETDLEYIDCQSANITIQSTGNDITIALYDPQGQVIDSQLTTMLHVDSLSVGEYSYSVMDECCEYRDSFIIESPQLCIVNDPEYCYLSSDTVIINFCDSNLDIADGTYDLYWETNFAWGGTTNIIEDLLMHPETFLYFTVTDSLGCIFQDTILFHDLVPETLTFFDGLVDTVTNCVPGYIQIIEKPSSYPIDSFRWNDTQLQDTIRLVDTPGTYSITSFYNGSCSAVQEFIVPSKYTLDSIEQDIQIVRPIKYCDTMLRFGEIVIEISDSVTASIDSFYWHDDPSIDSLYRDSLIEGNYCVTYFIAGGCEQTKCYQVLTRNVRPEVRVIEAQMPECFDEGFSLCDGLLDIEISWPAWLPVDLRLPISSRWRHPDGTYIYVEDLVDQCPEEGNFILEIDYGNALCRQQYFFRICCCEWEAEGDINSPLLCDPGNPYPIIPPIQFSYNNPSTPSSQDGYIKITNIFPSPPKVITWSGPNGFHALNTSVIRNLVAGRYCVTVEVPGCSATRAKKCINLVPCTQITINPNPTIEPPCMGDGGGSISLDPSGGNGPYTFEWINEPGGNSSILDSINAGTYTVVIEEKGGCEQTFDIEVLDTVVSFDGTSCEWVYESCDIEWREPCNTFQVVGEEDCRYLYEICECTGDVIDTLYKDFIEPSFDGNCNYTLTCPWEDQDIVLTGFGYFDDEYYLDTAFNECRCIYKTFCVTPFGPFEAGEPVEVADEFCGIDTWFEIEARISDDGSCGCYEVWYCGSSDRSIKTETGKFEIDESFCNLQSETIGLFLEGEDGLLDCYIQDICIYGENDTTFSDPLFAGDPQTDEWTLVSSSSADSAISCFRIVSCENGISYEIEDSDSIPARLEVVPDTTCLDGSPRYEIYCGDSLMAYSCDPAFGGWPPNEDKNKLTIEEGKDELLIYPNPTLDNISVLSSIGLRELEIYSVSGKLIKSTEINEQQKVFTATVSLVGLPPGTYIIKIWTMDGLSTSRIIIKL